jgi:hypothetical protein
MAKSPDEHNIRVMAAVYDEAITNALIHGFGLVKISHVGGCLDFEAVSPSEFRDLAESLIWASNHIKEVPVQ